MWVIQNQGLLQLPDDVPVPPNSVKVNLPSDFHQRSHIYKIEGDAVVKRSDEERRAIQQPRKRPQFSRDEIAALKKAIKEGKL